MNPNVKLLQYIPAVQIAGPVDINGAAATTPYISSKVNTRFALLIALGAVGATTTFTVKQAKDVDGTGAKAVTLVAGQVYSGARGDMLEQDDDAIAAGAISAVAGYANSVILIDLKAEDLDRANGFCYLAVHSTNPGASVIASIVALPHGDQRYSSFTDGVPDVTL